jgi:proteic killer suppression protein
VKVEFADSDLERLEQDRDFTAGYDRAVVKAFRRRVQFIRAAKNETDFYAMKSLHYEKLKGKRKHQRSMRLSRQWRLILEIRKDAKGNIVVIVSIEDYH